MSIASVGASSPLPAPETSSPNGKPHTADARDRTEQQQPPRAPLPPGQGTRIDLLV